MKSCKNMIFALAAFPAAILLMMPSQLRAEPHFLVGQTTRAELTRELGTPTAEMSFADGTIRVRWPRTVFNGVSAQGERVIIPMTFYDCEFGSDGLLKAMRPVDKSVAFDSPLLFPDHTDPASIHGAAKNGDLEKVKALLLANHDLIFSKGNEDRTPLHFAAAKGNKDVVEFLLANKAEPDAKDKYGMTPLDVAASNGHRDVAQLLLANKADVNARDNDGWTPLHFAAVHDHKGVAELLLANNAELDARNTLGQTPLYWAAAHGQTGVAELLLARGADANAKSNHGKTPLWIAASNKHKDMEELLRQHGGRK